MQYRTLQEADYPLLQALDLRWQRHAEPQFDQLPERERESRLSTSLAALKFYARSEHSFVADDEDAVRGFVMAQSVWQGDRPMLLVRSLVADPEAGEEVVRGLLHAVVKSAYDCAVYEVHLPVTPQCEAAVRAEEAHVVGRYGVIHLGTRAQTAPGEKLTKELP